MNRIKMNEIIKTFGIFLAVAILALGLVLPQQASAALPAPNWLPGQPMMAGNQVIAMWIPVPGAVKYIIYLNGIKIMESPANQYIGPAPEAAGDYAYEIAPVDAAGVEGPKSAVGMIRITKLEPPGKMSFRLDPVGKSVSLRWSKPAGAKTFNLYRADSKDGPYSMINSGMEDVFKDSNLELGKEYYYKVAARDIMGKESEKSVATMILLKEQKISAADTAKTPSLRIVPTTRVDVMEYWPGTEFRALSSYPFLMEDGSYFVVSVGRIVHFNSNVEVINSWPIRLTEEMQKEIGRPLGFNALAMFNEDEGILTDTRKSYVYFFEIGPASAIITTAYELRQPSEDEKPEVFEKIQANRRGMLPIPVGIAILGDGETVWVPDNNTGLVVILNQDEGVYDWNIGYTSPNTKQEVILITVIQGMTLPDGDVILFSAIDRMVTRLNPDTMEIKYEIGTGNWAGFVGKFIGIGGASLHNGKFLIISDPTMHHVQVFDVDTGTYLYSYGGPEGVVDPGNTNRPKLDYSAPGAPIVSADGKILYVYLPQNKLWLVRQIGDADGSLRAGFVAEALKKEKTVNKVE